MRRSTNFVILLEKKMFWVSCATTALLLTTHNPHRRYDYLKMETDELSVLVLPNHQHILKMGAKLDPETSENLRILTRLSARENVIEYG